jgi:hypothetical protein
MEAATVGSRKKKDSHFDQMMLYSFCLFYTHTDRIKGKRLGWDLERRVERGARLETKTA